VDTQIVVRIDKETKQRFGRLVRMEGKSASEKIRNMVDEYISRNDLPTVVDDLWERIGARLRDRGVTEKDVGRAVRDARAPR